MKNKEYNNMIEKAAKHIEKVELVRDLRMDIKTLKTELHRAVKKNVRLESLAREQDEEIRRLRNVVQKMEKYEELANIIKKIVKEDVVTF